MKKCCRNCREKVYIPYPYHSPNLGEDGGHPAIKNYCLERFKECGDWNKSEIQNIEKCAEFCPNSPDES